MSKVGEQDLRRELREIQDQHPKLKDDDVFVLWFLQAFVCDDADQAIKALCGGSGDKSVDAVLLDDQTRTIFLVQGKYRQRVGEKAESRTDVEPFAHLAPAFAGDHSTFAGLMDDLAPEVAKRIAEARERIKKRDYRLKLYYVTTGRCSDAVKESAARIVRSATGIKSSIEIIDGARVLLMLADYLDGVAPPVPSLDLEIESGQGVKTSGVLQRYDGRTRIESWVFSISDETVSNLFNVAGTRLFARNVRGFLGSTEINRGMQSTLDSEPEFFWYYNNGITIICDHAERISHGGMDIMRVANPQVINGQQTTRTLSAAYKRASRASVLVRVICVPRDIEKTDSFDGLVSRIVGATNWQNQIRPSDLMSNDRRQIDIDRQLRKLGYFYLRKRMKKNEARRAAGGHQYHIIKKDEVAQAVAATEFDPAMVREGKELLFEERWYPQVFPNSDPAFYLNRYWLLRQVSYMARGHSERIFAKWLVVHFVWHYVAPILRTIDARARFWRGCLRNGDGLRRLYQAIDTAFRAVLRFYKKKKARGDTAQNFFKRKGLHKEFERFWSGSANSFRTAFKGQIVRFGQDMAAEK